MCLFSPDPFSKGRSGEAIQVAVVFVKQLSVNILDTRPTSRTGWELVGVQNILVTVTEQDGLSVSSPIICYCL